jgi:hypothetical protein
MTSEFAKQKAWSRLKGVRKKSTLWVHVPGGAYRTIKAPGKVMLIGLSVYPTGDCVLEVQDALVEFPLVALFLAGSESWELDQANTSGTLSLVLRNRTSVPMSARLEIDWTVI